MRGLSLRDRSLAALRGGRRAWGLLWRARLGDAGSWADDRPVAPKTTATVNRLASEENDVRRACGDLAGGSRRTAGSWRPGSRMPHPTGSRGTLVGGCKGATPLCPPSLAVEETSEGVSVQTRTPFRAPSHQPAGIAKRVVESSAVPQGDVRCLPRFLMEATPPAAGGVGPLDPQGAVARWV